jgi:hypothetical protein
MRGQSFAGLFDYLPGGEQSDDIHDGRRDREGALVSRLFSG